MFWSTNQVRNRQLPCLQDSLHSLHTCAHLRFQNFSHSFSPIQLLSITQVRLNRSSVATSHLPLLLAMAMSLPLIVLVVVSSAHRGQSFQACEFLMDYLKTQAPFWKKEQTPEGARWVDARVSDDAALAKWGIQSQNA